MKALAALALVLTASSFATTAGAGLNPYVRVAFGASQLKMAAANERMRLDETDLKNAGYDPHFTDIGMANGPSASAGVWLFPAFRVGAAYSLFNATHDNRLHVPGYIFYDNEVNFRMHEIGADVAFRVPRWGGLSFGGTYSRGEASAVAGYTVQEFGFSNTFQDVTGHSERNTYGLYLGLDQTNEHGIAGYLRAGYRFCDVGAMTFSGVDSDGFTATPISYKTVDMDFSGYYVVFGTGFDFRH